VADGGCCLMLNHYCLFNIHVIVHPRQEGVTGMNFEKNAVNMWRKSSTPSRPECLKRGQRKECILFSGN
jgi:hypothetical protein